jgi:hypothetical protein
MDQITIAGRAFAVPTRYKEGDTVTLSAGEASSFNQTFHENVRNNIANKIKASVEGDFKPTEFWSDENFNHWQHQVNEYAEKYQFGVRAGGSGRVSMDPELKLAVEEASAAIVAAVKGQGKTPPKGKDLRDLALQVLDGPQGDRFRQIAKRRLRQTREAATSVLEGTGLLAAE